jgi:multidrug resistance efflux pump
MRGRWASAAIGAGVARRRAGEQMDHQSQQYEAQLEAQQRQIESLQQQKQAQPQQAPQTQQEDLTLKLKKYDELRKQGVLSEEEFQKLKTDLISKM